MLYTKKGQHCETKNWSLPSHGVHKVTRFKVAIVTRNMASINTKKRCKSLAFWALNTFFPIFCVNF